MVHELTSAMVQEFTSAVVQELTSAMVQELTSAVVQELTSAMVQEFTSAVVHELLTTPRLSKGGLQHITVMYDFNISTKISTKISAEGARDFKLAYKGFMRRKSLGLQIRFQPGFSRECTRFPTRCRTPQCTCSYRHCTYTFTAELSDLVSLRK